MTQATVTVDAETLREAMTARLIAAGQQADMAEATATILLEADLLGHRTHGAAMLPIYLDCLADGSMARSGAVEVLSERSAAACWLGHRLSGAWLVLRAIETAEAMARAHGTGTVVIGRSFHIGCLASYLEAVAARGLVLVLQTSAPHATTVAPHGGKSPVLSPGPLAIGYPTDGDPVLIDISTSVTSNSNVRKVARGGGRLPGPWVIGADGRQTDDPGISEVVLPLGGIDAGHKGFGLGLMVEALTGGLAGISRSEPAPRMGGTVLVQVIDPDAFGGLDAMRAAMGHVGDLCRAADPIDPSAPVRLPGQAALAHKRRQLRDGIELDEDLWTQLAVPG